MNHHDLSDSTPISPLGGDHRDIPDQTKEALISYLQLSKKEQARFRLMLYLKDARETPSYLDEALNSGSGVYKP